jgi:hypothetical protein
MGFFVLKQRQKQNKDKNKTIIKNI